MLVTFIAAHAYALRAHAQFNSIPAVQTRGAHSHSRFPPVLHPAQDYGTHKENYPPEAFVSTLPVIVRNKLMAIPAPARNPKASAGARFKLHRFQPYARAKAKKMKLSLHSPISRPLKRSQGSTLRPSAPVESIGQRKTLAEVHPGPEKCAFGCPDCSCVADDVVAKKVKFVEPKLPNAKLLEKRSFCRWIAKYLFSTVLNSDHWQVGSIPLSALDSLAVRLERIAFDLNPSQAVFFLALFYVSWLFPRGIIARDLYRRESLIVRTLARMFTLGFMLANKWLDDCSYQARTLRTYFDSNCSLRSINSVEMAALVAFGFDIGLSTQTWIRWLQQLRSIASDVGERDQCEDSPITYIDRLLLEARDIEKSTAFKSSKCQLNIPAPLLQDVYDALVSDVNGPRSPHPRLATLASKK